MERVYPKYSIRSHMTGAFYCSAMTEAKAVKLALLLNEQFKASDDEETQQDYADIFLNYRE